MSFRGGATCEKTTLETSEVTGAIPLSPPRSALGGLGVVSSTGERNLFHTHVFFCVELARDGGLGVGLLLCPV